MALTRDFKDTIQARALRDTEFRHGLLVESIECILIGDVETGKSLLRDYINATIGFEELGTITHKSPKSLMRMLSIRGNPNIRNLSSIFQTLQKEEGIELQIQVAEPT